VSGGADPVVVATAPDAVSGAVLAGALESAGIPVQVLGAGTGWLFPGAEGGLGPVRILVPAAAEAEARAILTELDAG
jgi:hypothetical protein